MQIAKKTKKQNKTKQNKTKKQTDKKTNRQKKGMTNRSHPSLPFRLSSNYTYKF